MSLAEEVAARKAQRRSAQQVNLSLADPAAIVERFKRISELIQELRDAVE